MTKTVSIFLAMVMCMAGGPVWAGTFGIHAPMVPDGAAWPERERSLYDPAQSRYERAVRRRGIF